MVKYLIFLLPILGFSQPTDPAYATEQGVWNAAGVPGGIPESRTAYSTVSVRSGQNNITSSVNGATTWQAEIDAAALVGGLQEIYVNDGTYKISAFDMDDNVVIVGESIDGVILESELRNANSPQSILKVGIIEFNGSTTNSGVENLTLFYRVDGCDITNFEGTDLFTPSSFQSSYYTNDPCGLTNLYVTGFEFRESATGNWIRNVKIIDIGDSPVWIFGDNNTVDNCSMENSYMKGTGGIGYVGIAGDNNLLIGNDFINQRHVAFNQDGPREPQDNVLVFNYVEGDINWHDEGESSLGRQLVENNEVRKPAWHAWGPLHTGELSSGHAAPKTTSYLFKNLFYDDDSTLEFSDASTVYQPNGNYKSGAEEGFAATALTVPTTGTFYTAQTRSQIGFNASGVVPPFFIGIKSAQQLLKSRRN